MSEEKTNPDLFGGESRIVSSSRPGTYADALKKRNYRKQEFGNPYRCKNCKHFIRKEYAKRYFKCELLGDTRSEATDIKANNVCDLYEKK